MIYFIFIFWIFIIIKYFQSKKDKYKNANIFNFK